MVVQEIRDLIAESNEEAVVFDNPSFDNSIIGMTDYGSVVYSYEKMVEELSKDDGMSELEAMEFIDYNTIRTIPYISGSAPVIMYELPR